MLRIIVGQKQLSWMSKFKFMHRFIVVRADELKMINDKKLSDLAYQTLIMFNKTSKQTKYDRFHDVESKMISLLQTMKSKIKIHDIAVSSGVSSKTMYDNLGINNIESNVTISDKFSKVYLSNGNYIQVLFDNDRKLIAIYFFSLYFSNQLSWNYFISNIGFYLLRNIFKFDNAKLNEILLFDNSILKLIDNNHISNIEYDIFNTKINKRFNFVRAMNILNLNYFNKELIIKALRNILFSIEEDGIFLVGRTIDNKNYVSFFINKNKKFILLDSINGGSEIEDIVLDI